MINKFTGFIASTCLAFSFHSFAFISNQAEINEKGKPLYQQCVACHGHNGEGNDALNAPALAGQFNWYLSKQIINFAKDLRGAHEKDTIGMQMLPLAKQLDPIKDVPLLSAYIQSLPVVKKQFNETGNMVNGSRYYQGKCGACHGGTAQGNKSLNAPKLTGLSDVYLLRQMANFSNGLRGYKAEDKLGRQMAMMAKTTSGQELNDIVFYILSQENTSTSK
jgi:cytochrome c oxidase subunit 2